MALRRRNLAIVETRPVPDGLARVLRHSVAYAPVPAASLEAAGALAAGREPRIDAVVLDLAAAEDGAAMCRRLRAEGVRIPILILSPAAGVAEVVAGLDAGANDYIVKPYRLGEVMARLRAHIHSMETRGEAVLPIGRYQFRPAQRTLTHPRLPCPIRLTHREAELLAFLYRAGPGPVSRSAMLRELWGFAPGVDSHTIETHIYRIRRKIQPDPDGALLLINEADGGYRLGYEPGLAAAARASVPDRARGRLTRINAAPG